MAMLTIALHLVNVILLLVLLYIYIQNYRQLKAKMTAGLVLFALFFLTQSLMNIYFDTTMIMYSSGSAETAAMVLEAAKAIGFAVLVWISWD